jgi:hypothetical protein
MNWVRAIAGVLVLWSSTAWGATLTWNANRQGIASIAVVSSPAPNHLVMRLFSSHWERGQVSMSERRL